MLRPVLGRWEKWVNSHSECVFQHRGDQPCKQRTTQFQTRIGVYLDEPSPEVLVDHEVKSKDLETELPMFCVDDQMGSSD